MIRTLVPLLAVFAVSPALAAGPTPKALCGDVSELVHKLKKESAKQDVQFTAAGITNIRHETSCMDVVFEKEQGPESNIHILTSKTWIEECRNLPIPGGGCIPERRSWSHAATFLIELVGRTAPGPREVFEVCMTGPWLKEPSVKESPNQYKVGKKEEGGLTRFKLTKKEPKKKN